MSTRAALGLFLLLAACLSGCAPVAVEHRLYSPDKTVVGVIPREVALAQLNKYVDATDEGVSMYGMKPMPYGTIVNLELVPIRGGKFILFLGAGKYSWMARNPVESMDEGRKTTECLISLGARINR